MMKKIIRNDEKKSLRREGEKFGKRKLIYDDQKKSLGRKEEKVRLKNKKP